MAPGKLVKLGEFYMVPGYSTEKLQAFLATELYPESLPTDEDELLERTSLSIQETLGLARAGKILDGKTLAVLLLAQPLLSQLAGDEV